MALEDIVLGSTDLQELIVEIPLDTLNAPVDILFDQGANFILETEPAPVETFSGIVF